MPPIPPPESALRLVPEHPLEGVAVRSVLDELRVDVLVHVAALDALDPEAEVLEHDDAALPLAALPASPLGEPADLVDAHLLRQDQPSLVPSFIASQSTSLSPPRSQ